MAKKVCVTAEGFLKERVYDCSIRRVEYYILFPSKTLANGMSLEWSGCMVSSAIYPAKISLVIQRPKKPDHMRCWSDKMSFMSFCRRTIFRFSGRF